MDVRGGADGVVAWLEEWQLSEQQGGRHLNGGELLQHLHQGWVVEPLPLLVLLQALWIEKEEEQEEVGMVKEKEEVGDEVVLWVVEQVVEEGGGDEGEETEEEQEVEDEVVE